MKEKDGKLEFPTQDSSPYSMGYWDFIDSGKAANPFVQGTPAFTEYNCGVEEARMELYYCPSMKISGMTAEEQHALEIEYGF